MVRVHFHGFVAHLRSRGTLSKHCLSPEAVAECLSSLTPRKLASLPTAKRSITSGERPSVCAARLHLALCLNAYGHRASLLRLSQEESNALRRARYISPTSGRRSLLAALPHT